MAVATLGPVVLDCPDPQRLSDFYGAVLGWPEDPESEESWRELVGPQGRRIAFQQSLGHRPPQWPGTDRPQQFHLDLEVDKSKIDEAEQQVLDLGATLLRGDDDGARNFRVYADPAGHPFCLCAC
jgi:catechol 2,3-dioxygenase-like lactoylglutathione lyase family enzyme